MSIRGLIFLGLLGIIFPMNVLSHAEIVSVYPENGSVMENPPEHFSVKFSEPVSVIRIQILDGNRQILELGNVSNQDNVLTFSPLTPLPQGQYLLSFRVLSLDAHAVSGSVGFSVGNLPPPLPEFSQVNKTGLLLARINRTVHLLTILLTIGFVLYPLLFVMPAEIEPGRQRYLNLASFTGIITAVIGLGLWGVLLIEASPFAFFQGATWSIAMETTLGTSFFIVVSGFSGILMANSLDPTLTPGRISGLLGGFLILASLGASGHAFSSGWLMTPVFFIHTLVAGTWLGAIWMLRNILLPGNSGQLTHVLNTFSRMATWIVAVLLVSAVILIVFQLNNVTELLMTEYGNWILLKITVVLSALILAAVNRWKFVPALNENNQTVFQKLRKSVYVEGILLVVVIGITSILASTVPPKDETLASSKSVSIPIDETYSMIMLMTPAQTGNNRVELSFLQQDQPFEPMNVTVYWEQAQIGIERLSRQAQPSEDGEFILDNIDILVPGIWRFQVEVLIDDFTRERINTDITIE